MCEEKRTFGACGLSGEPTPFEYAQWSPGLLPQLFREGVALSLRPLQEHSNIIEALPQKGLLSPEVSYIYIYMFVLQGLHTSLSPPAYIIAFEISHNGLQDQDTSNCSGTQTLKYRSNQWLQDGIIIDFVVEISRGIQEPLFSGNSALTL